MFVLIANPDPTTAATVQATYLLDNGTTLTKTYTVAASSRRTIYVDDEQFPGGAAAGQRRDVDHPDLDQRRADRRRARDVVAGRRAGPVVRRPQLAGRDADRHRLGAGRGRGRRQQRRVDLHPGREHRRDRRQHPRDGLRRRRRHAPCAPSACRPQPLQRRRRRRCSDRRSPTAGWARWSRAWARARRRSSSSARCTRTPAVACGRPAPTPWRRAFAESFGGQARLR